MDKSRKVILASCLSVAFLAGIFACSVEDANLEKKDLFVCKTEPGCMGNNGVCEATGNGPCADETKRCAATSDDSCMSGSVCIAASPDALEGKCVLLDEVKHCHDNDDDGFLGADPGFESTCGFSDTTPMDCNDANKLINPSATELCDGIDNTCDGCVDGICPKGADCKSDASKCQPLVDLCLGSGTVAGMAAVAGGKSVCSPKIAGVTYCDSTTNGKEAFAVCQSGDCKLAADFKIIDGGSCPPLKEYTSDKAYITFQSYKGDTYYYTYDQLGNAKTAKITMPDPEDPTKEIEVAVLCQGYDNDCNGIIDDYDDATDRGCQQSCKNYSNLGKECYATKDGNVYDLDKSDDLDLATYESRPAACKGTRQCDAGAIGEPDCKSAGGELIISCSE